RNRSRSRGNRHMKTARSSRAVRAMRTLWVLEMVLLMLAVTAGVWLRFIGDNVGRDAYIETAPLRSLVVALVMTMAMAAFGLYQAHMRLNRVDFLLRLLLSFGFGGVALLVLYYVVPQTYIGRGVLAISLVIAFLCIYVLRMGSHHLFGTEVFKRRVLMFGAGVNADLVNSRLRRSSDRQAFTIVGFVPVPGQAVVVPDNLLIDPAPGLLQLTRTLGIHEIVVAPDERRGGLPMEEMLACAQKGVNVIDLAGFFEREAGMIKLNVVEPSALVFSGGFDHS